MRLTNDRASFTPVHPRIRAIGPRDLHHSKGRDLVEAEASRNRRLHDKLAILGTQAHFSTGAEANLLSQATRDPHPEAVSPFLDPRLHSNPAAIQRVYLLWVAAASPHLSNADHHLPAESYMRRSSKGTVNLPWRVRRMAGLVCGSQLLEELRHLRLQDNQI